jgi:hypothetical protein
MMGKKQIVQLAGAAARAHFGNILKMRNLGGVDTNFIA